LPSAKGAFYAWRTVVARRESTDRSVLEDPLVREAFAAGYQRGVSDRLALETEVGQALQTIRRFGELLEQFIDERAAMEIIAQEDE